MKILYSVTPTNRYHPLISSSTVQSPLPSARSKNQKRSKQQQLVRPDKARGASEPQTKQAHKFKLVGGGCRRARHTFDDPLLSAGISS